MVARFPMLGHPPAVIVTALHREFTEIDLVRMKHMRRGPQNKNGCHASVSEFQSLTAQNTGTLEERLEQQFRRIACKLPYSPDPEDCCPHTGSKMIFVCV